MGGRAAVCVSTLHCCKDWRQCSLRYVKSNLKDQISNSSLASPTGRYLLIQSERPGNFRYSIAERVSKLRSTTIDIWKGGEWDSRKWGHNTQQLEATQHIKSIRRMDWIWYKRRSIFWEYHTQLIIQTSKPKATKSSNPEPEALLARLSCHWVDRTLHKYPLV